MKKQCKEGKTIWRMPPCPDYDIAGTEQWLAEMAEKGYLLAKDGFFAGFANFEYRGRQNVKYRLEASQKKGGPLSDDGNEPDPEQIELSGKYSWEYVAKRNDFFIYRSTDPNAREMHTDPEVMALALNAVKKRRRSTLISALIVVFVYPLVITRGCLLLTAVTLGPWRTVSTLILAALWIADEIRALARMKMVQRSLREEGGFPPHSVNAGSKTRYLIRKAVKSALAVLLVCAALRSWGVSVMQTDKIPLEEYSGTVPFATIRDFAGEGAEGYRQTMTGLDMGFNTVSEQNSVLAPRCIYYDEFAEMKTAEGNRIEGGLQVEYYEMRSEGAAKLLETELYRFAKSQRNFEPMEAPALHADSVRAYRDYFPTVLIRKGSIVVKADYVQTSGNNGQPFAEWTSVLCDSIGAQE